MTILTSTTEIVEVAELIGVDSIVLRSNYVNESVEIIDAGRSNDNNS